MLSALRLSTPSLLDLSRPKGVFSLSTLSVYIPRVNIVHVRRCIAYFLFRPRSEPRQASVLEKKSAMFEEGASWLKGTGIPLFRVPTRLPYILYGGVPAPGKAGLLRILYAGSENTRKAAAIRNAIPCPNDRNVL